MEERMQAKLNKIDTNGEAPSAPAAGLDDDAPSAPVDDLAPSAPALIQTFHTPECVVCMERKVRMRKLCQKYNECWHLQHDLAPSTSLASANIFQLHSLFSFLKFQSCIILLPCGHLCSCSECSYDMSQCPLCRATIITRVNI